MSAGSEGDADAEARGAAEGEPAVSTPASAIPAPAPSRRTLGARLAWLFVSDPEKGRGNNINLLRFVAATAVICGHMSIFLGAAPIALCGQSVSTVGVYMFFTLSGFLICQSLMRDGQPFRYLVRRVFRIVPALIAVVVFSALVLGPCMTTLGLRDYFSRPDTWSYIYNNIAFKPQYSLPGVFEGSLYPNTVNGSLWTLPVEFSMYLILPCLLWAFNKLGVGRKGIAATGAVVFLFALAYEAGFWHPGIVIRGEGLESALTLMPFFFIGALVALKPEIQGRLNVQVGFMLLLAMVFLNIQAADAHVTGAVSYILQVALVPYITLAISFASPAKFSRVFAENDYSYGIYLWAFPIQQTLVQLIGTGAPGVLGYTLLSTFVTLLFAMASWFLVERPASRLGKRITAWSRARQAARAAA